MVMRPWVCPRRSWRAEARALRRYQGGAITYMMAVVMLLICTLVAGYALNDTVLGVRLAENELHAARATALARAGLAEGLARLADGPPSLPPDFSGGLSGQGGYRVHYAWRRRAAPPVLDVIAEGRVPGSVATPRALVQSAVFTPWLIDAPPVPVIARGTVRVAGRAILTSEDPTVPLIWSGGRAVVPAGSGLRYEDRDPVLRKLDSDAWVSAAFAAGPTRIRDLARRLPCKVCDLSKTPPPSRMFTAESRAGPVTLRTTAPSKAADRPRIAFIQGDLEVRSPLVFEGLLFVTGSVVVDHPSVSIRGALIAGGDITLRAGAVIHAKGTFGRLRKNGYFAPLAGSLHERFAGG